MAPMRILMLTFNVAYTGGATFYRALHLSQGLAKRGHQVTLIASSPGAVLRFHEEVKKGVRIVAAPGIVPTRWRHGYDPYEAIRRIAWLSPRRYEIVHAFDNRPVVVYPALAAQRQGGRLVMDWCDWFGRGGSAEQRPNPILRAIMRYLDTYYEEAFRLRANATTVINSTLHARAIRLGIPAEQIMRLPNGADIETIQPVAPQAARAALGLPQEGLILGYMGALFPADASLLCAAFRRVQAARPDTRLMLIGNPKVEIPCTEGLLRIGFVPYAQLGLYLSSCDILLLPLTNSQANRGRWPSKIGDYLAAGRPTVACAVGDVPEIFAATGAGVATHPTPLPFAEAILALSGDPAARARLGAQARQAAETQLDWQILVGQVEALYRRLLS